MSKTKLYYIALVIAAVAALFMAWHRNHIENRYKGFELVLDYDASKKLARNANLPLASLLQKFQLAGATAVALNESTLISLRTDGKISWLVGNELLNYLPGARPKFDKVYVLIYDPGTMEQLTSFLPVFLGATKVNLLRPLSRLKPAVLEIAMDEQDLNQLGLGFNPREVEWLQANNYKVILRPENKDQLTLNMLEKYYKLLEPLRPFAIIFGGSKNEVLGYPDYLKESAQALSRTPALLGIIEAPSVQTLQKGSTTLGRYNPGRVLRVQSLPVLQQQKLKPSDAADIFRLGIKERNIRLLYLRPFYNANAQQDVIALNAGYIRALKTGLEPKGFKAGKAHALPETGLPLWVALCLTAGIWGCVMLLFPGVSCALSWSGLAAGLGMTLAGHFIPGLKPWFQILALLAAVCFPVLALSLFFTKSRSWATLSSFGKIFQCAMLFLILASLVSTLGGLIVSALLSSPAYWLQIERFRGIKLLMVLPLILTLWLWARSQGYSLSAFFNQPLRLWQFIGLLCLTLLGIFYLARTGNAPEGLSPEWEKHLRLILEQILAVRPRFKEFLIGHPALMLLPFLYARKWQHWIWLGWAGASLGQADLVDSFAHLHTPLTVTLLREGNGLWLGALIALITAGIFWKQTSSPHKED